MKIWALIPIRLSGIYHPPKLILIKKILLFILVIVLLLIPILLKHHQLQLISFLMLLSIVGVLGFKWAPFMAITDVSDQHAYLNVVLMMMYFNILIRELQKKFKFNFLLHPLLSLMLISFIVITAFRTPTFKNSEKFYRNVFKNYPESITSYANLQFYYRSQKQYQKAYEVLLESLPYIKEAQLWEKNLVLGMFQNLQPHVTVDPKVFKTETYSDKK
jgi:hypothetical protein